MGFSSPPGLSNRNGLSSRYGLSIGGGLVDLADTDYVPTIQESFLSSNSYSTLNTLVSTRASNAMYYDSNGILTFAPANMFINSTNLNASNWTKFNATNTAVSSGFTAPDGTSTAQKIYETNTNTSARSIYQSIPTPTNYYKRIFSFYAKESERRYVQAFDISGGLLGRLVFDVSTGNPTSGTATQNTSSITNTISDAGNSWWRISIILPSTIASVAFAIGICSGATSSGNFGDSYVGVTNNGLLLWGPQAELVTFQNVASQYIPTTSAAIYLPRFDYNPAVSPATAMGLFIEPASTNRILHTITFRTTPIGSEQVWADTNITRVSTSRTSPDGSGNALEVSASSANGTIIASAAIGSSAERVLSVWLKRVSGTGNIQYTLDNGLSWATQAITSSWVRYEFPSTTANQRVGFRIVTSGDTIQIWGAQLENNSYATSYMPTYNAIVGRSADIVQLTGTALTVAGASTGTAFIQTTKIVNASITRDLLSSSTNRRLLYVTSSSTNLSTFDGTNTTSTTLGSGTWVDSVSRGAVAWAGSVAIVGNAGTLVTGNTNLGSSAAVYVGGFSSSGTVQPTWIQSLAFYNYALPNSVLSSKSTVGASY